jgi:hypothetical protein
MTNLLFRYLLMITGLLVSQEIFSTTVWKSAQEPVPFLSLNEAKNSPESGGCVLKTSRNHEGLVIDVADINFHIEDEEEEDHQPTCKRSRISLLPGFLPGDAIFQFSSFVGQAFSFISLPAFYPHQTCIRYIRFQVFRL